MRKLFRNKKAALQLSINAIVVLILAITILGLGLGFIKSQFGSLGEQFSSVSAEIKSELINKIKDSGELLSFNKVELQVKIGKPETFYVGVKNTANNIEDPDNPNVCFTTEIRCLQGLTDPCIEGLNDVLVGGVDGGLKDGDGPLYGTWFTVFKAVNIKSGDTGVYPIKIQIASAKPGTYLMVFNVYKYTGDCADGNHEDKPYQSKEFFVELT